MEESSSKNNSQKSTERTYSLKSVVSRKNVTIKEDFKKTENEIDLKEKYDGLTDAEDEKLIKHFSQKENVTTIVNNTNVGNKEENQPSVFNARQAESELGSNESFSSKESITYESSKGSDTLSDDDSYYNGKSPEKLDLRELQPMETLSWLKNHGLKKMAFIISKERESKLVEKIRDKTVMGLYNADIKKFKQGYLKNLFLLSLDKGRDRLSFEESVSQPEREEAIKNSLYLNNVISVEPINERPSHPNDTINKSEVGKKYIKPKLINRLEISEEGISGENALAFQKYIKDLQEEVKMKDEKLKLREMERDNARLTRDQLTRAVKSSLEIGSGAGKLDNVIRDVIKRNLTYAFRILQYQARIELKGKLGSEIFAGAFLIKQIILKRIKYGFSQLMKNSISKKDEMFWKKNVVNNEDVAKNIISVFKNILSCYKLACIVQHNHISAIKKFLYIWTKCSNLKSEAISESSILRTYSRMSGKTTLRELKTVTDTKSKNFSRADKHRLNSAKKGFFSEDNFTKIKSNSNILGEDISTKEILSSINDTLSFVPDERLNHLTMLMNKSQEQKKIDMSRNLALSHLSDVIKSSLETKDSKEHTSNDALNTINNLNTSHRDKLLSSFENLIFNKERIDIINEIKSHANDKYKQPISAPDWIKEKHSKLLEDFYSNPFYSVFVNEYNKRIFMDYKESSEDESESSEEHQPEIYEYETESEYDVYYYSKEGPEPKQFSVQKQQSGEIHIDPERLELDVSKADNVYICDEASQFETIYYYDENYLENVEFDADGNQIIYIDKSNISMEPYRLAATTEQTEVTYEEAAYNPEDGLVGESNEAENNTEITELQLANEEYPPEGVNDSNGFNPTVENIDYKKDANEEVVQYVSVVESEVVQ